MGVHLLTGDNDGLMSTAIHELVDVLVAGADRTLMVDDFDTDDYAVRQVVDAATTPPFLTDRRIVVARGIGRFASDELAPLLAYLADPLETTELVLGGGGGRLPKALTDAVAKAGGTVKAAGPPAAKRDRTGWIDERVATAGLQLDHGATARIVQQLGEDLGRLDGLLDTLVSAFGEGARLRAADVEPFLGEEGGAPPWELTDAIDKGETAKALHVLGRTTRAGGRHPLQVMAILHGHYTRLLRLDGADVRSDDDAAALLGVKSGFQAAKARSASQRLGPTGVRRAFQLLAEADLVLRGTRDWDDQLTLEVLVARLSRLGSVRAEARPRR
jgi:DNA polymerase-3 subunit delta